MNILLIDDDHGVLGALMRILTADGAQADCVDNAPDAIRALARTHYDLILLDVRMPDKDGLWFLRHATIPESTPVVLMSAYRTPGVLDDLPALGVAAFLEKPFGIAAVTRMVERFAHHSIA